MRTVEGEGGNTRRDWTEKKEVLVLQICDRRMTLKKKKTKKKQKEKKEKKKKKNKQQNTKKNKKRH